MNNLTHYPEHVEAGWLSEPAESGGGTRERVQCMDCDWFGTDASAYRHHAEHHHQMVLAYWPALGHMKFSCCSDSQGGRP